MVDLQFSSAPDKENEYKVGEIVEVYCDHDDPEDNRTRDWLEGIVVHVEPKIIAVQFEQNVYLTDGWMVPDHVLWCPYDSKTLRYALKIKRRPRTK